MSKKGDKHPNQSIKMKGRNNPMFGKKLSLEERKARSIAQLRRVKEGRHNWGDGSVGDTNVKVRRSFEYKLWKEAVFKRDNWTCIWCKKRGVRLNADHIKPFALYPELRFAIDNGRTLCEPCHRTTDTFSIKMRPMKSLNSITQPSSALNWQTQGSSAKTT